MDDFAGRHHYDSQISGLRSNIRSITDTMKQGFEHMERRFDDVNRRFRMMFTFITIGFTALAAMSVLFKFLA